MDPRDEFLTLFLQHQHELRAFIGSVVRERGARDDVLQETALVLWRDFERYDRGRSFGAWARGIAAKKLLQRLERGTRGARSLPVEAIPVVLAAYERADGATEVRRDALEQCLRQLPPKSQSLLELRYQHALTLAQVAQRVHSTTDAVHKALSRIRLKLQECIEHRLRAAGEAP